MGLVMSLGQNCFIHHMLSSFNVPHIRGLFSLGGFAKPFICSSLNATERTSNILDSIIDGSITDRLIDNQWDGVEVFEYPKLWNYRNHIIIDENLIKNLNKANVFIYRFLFNEKLDESQFKFLIADKLHIINPNAEIIVITYKDSPRYNQYKQIGVDNHTIWGTDDNRKVDYINQYNLNKWFMQWHVTDYDKKIYEDLIQELSV